MHISEQYRPGWAPPLAIFMESQTEAPCTSFRHEHLFMAPNDLRPTVIQDVRYQNCRYHLKRKLDINIISITPLRAAQLIQEGKLWKSNQGTRACCWFQPQGIKTNWSSHDYKAYYSLWISSDTFLASGSTSSTPAHSCTYASLPYLVKYTHLFTR